MKLSEYLEDVGIPQSVFAKKLGVSPGTVHKIMREKGNFYLSTALKIEDLTGGKVTCRELLSKNPSEDHKKKYA